MKIALVTFFIALSLTLVSPDSHASPSSSSTLRHSSSQTPIPPLAALRAGYHKGFFLSSDDGLYQLKIGGRVQVRAVGEIEGQQISALALSLPRARLAIKGKALTPGLSYKFQADFGKGAVALKDFFINYSFDKKWLQLRVGQYKRPFSRQNITSSGKLELVDRAITEKAFQDGRDIGLMLHNGYEKSPQIEYAIGVFNGTGDKGRFKGETLVDLSTGEGEVSGKFSNVPSLFRPTLAMRLAYNHGGIKGYSEGDLTGSGPRVSVGLSERVDFDVDGDGASSVESEVDFVAKAWGASLSGAAYLATASGGHPLDGVALDSVGTYVQLGYVIADLAQPAFRYALVSSLHDTDQQHELLAGLSIYPFGHKLKWQTDAGLLLNDDGQGLQPAYRVRTQINMAF